MHWRIQDAVVGDIEPTATQMMLLQDPHMQRLRHIRQLSFANLVYPSANHTRFEHSLGTMQITKEVVHSTLKEKNEELECVGLLHDIGHSAFSHSADGLLQKYLKTTHEKIGEELLMKSSMKDILQDSTMSLKNIQSYFRGEGYGSIITGAIGSDRLDYLARDSHYTGVAYGVINYSNIAHRLVLYNNTPAVYEKGVTAAESMLIARYTMFSSVYHHHVTRIAESMYEKAVEFALQSKELDPESLRVLNDWEMINKLINIDRSKELMQRILTRRLFKRAYYKPVSGLVDPKEIRSALEKNGFGEGDYIINMIKIKGGSDDIDVVDKDGKFVGKLTSVSPLVKTLTTVLDGRQKLLVACDAKDKEKVGAIIEKHIGS